MKRIIYYQALKHFAFAVQVMLSAAASVLCASLVLRMNGRVGVLYFITLPFLLINNLIGIPITNRYLAMKLQFDSMPEISIRSHSKKYL